MSQGNKNNIDENFIEAVSIPYVEHEQIALRFNFIEEDIQSAKDALFDPIINNMLYQEIDSKLKENSITIESVHLDCLPEQFTCYQEQYSNNRTNSHYSYIVVNNQTKRIILTVSIRDYLYSSVLESASTYFSLWSTHIGRDHRIAMDALNEIFTLLVDKSSLLLISKGNHFKEYRRLYAKLMFMAICDIKASCTQRELHQDIAIPVDTDNLESVIDSLDSEHQYFCIQKK